MWGDDLIYDVAQLVLVKCSNFPLGLEPDVVPADYSVLHAHNGQSEGKTTSTQHELPTENSFVLRTSVAVCICLCIFVKLYGYSGRPFVPHCNGM